MASPFGARDLIGKLVCGMSDARFSGRMDLCTERLLQISGEDTILIDRKHKDSVTARLNTRIIIASNNEVRLPDESGTIASRILTIRFNRSFLDREDMNLERDLANEIDGIADWALDGLDSLRARGRFAEPASSLAERERCQRNSSPVISFIEECLVVDANVKVERGLLYRHWIEWADKSGHQRSSRTKFLSQLRALGYGEKKTSSARYITGLDLPGAFI
jgi:putative DNA primase/helicase